MNGVVHKPQCGVDDRASIFGIEVLHQLGRALDVGKQRRHHLALALRHFIRFDRRKIGMSRIGRAELTICLPDWIDVSQ